jgi:hypothetical protein
MTSLNETRRKTFEVIAPVIAAVIKEKTPQPTDETKFPYYKIDFSYS